MSVSGNRLDIIIAHRRCVDHDTSGMVCIPSGNGEGLYWLKGEACFVILQQFPKARIPLIVPVHPGFLSSEQSQLGTRLEIFNPAKVTTLCKRGMRWLHPPVAGGGVADREGCNKNIGL